jgi:hypothetical protein
MEDIEYRIENWNKYNPRKDRRSHNWFRLDNDFFMNKDLFDLEVTDRIVLLYLFCDYSKNHNGDEEKVISLNFRYAAYVLRISEKEIYKSFQVLKNKGIVSIGLKRLADGIQADLLGSAHTNKQTDSTLELIENHSPEKPTDKGSISELENPVYNHLLQKVTRYSQDNWMVVYDDIPWIQNELLKMVTWIADNPRKSPKSNYSRFIGSWLSRGWEKHRVNPNARKASALSAIDQIKQENFGGSNENTEKFNI